MFTARPRSLRCRRSPGPSASARATSPARSVARCAARPPAGHVAARPAASRPRRGARAQRGTVDAHKGGVRCGSCRRRRLRLPENTGRCGGSGGGGRRWCRERREGGSEAIPAGAGPWPAPQVPAPGHGTRSSPQPPRLPPALRVPPPRPKRRRRCGWASGPRRRRPSSCSASVARCNAASASARLRRTARSSARLAARSRSVSRARWSSGSSGAAVRYWARSIIERRRAARCSRNLRRAASASAGFSVESMASSLANRWRNSGSPNAGCTRPSACSHLFSGAPGVKGRCERLGRIGQHRAAQHDVLLARCPRPSGG